MPYGLVGKFGTDCVNYGWRAPRMSQPGRRDPACRLLSSERRPAQREAFSAAQGLHGAALEARPAAGEDLGRSQRTHPPRDGLPPTTGTRAGGRRLKTVTRRGSVNAAGQKPGVEDGWEVKGGGQAPPWRRPGA